MFLYWNIVVEVMEEEYTHLTKLDEGKAGIDISSIC